MINVGDILSTMGVFSTVGGYHEYRGGYLEYRGGCSVPWGDIMSTAVLRNHLRISRNTLLLLSSRYLNISRYSNS